MTAYAAKDGNWRPKSTLFHFSPLREARFLLCGGNAQDWALLKYTKFVEHGRVRDCGEKIMSAATPLHHPRERLYRGLSILGLTASLALVCVVMFGVF